MALTSIGTKIKRIAGLAGTKDVSKWESQFISDLDDKTAHGVITGQLTEKQIAIIDRIHGQHFEAAP